MRSTVWLAMLMAISAAHAYEPKVNYMLNCMGCHLEDGSGAAGKVPSMRNTLVPFAQLKAGRRYLVQVPGTSQSSLTNREVAQVLNWMIRNLAARPAPSGLRQFTEAEVAYYRRERLTDVAATRATLLSAVAQR
jgi:hypothetical protein